MWKRLNWRGNCLFLELIIFSHFRVQLFIRRRTIIHRGASIPSRIHKWFRNQIELFSERSTESLHPVDMEWWGQSSGSARPSLFFQFRRFISVSSFLCRGLPPWCPFLKLQVSWSSKLRVKPFRVSSIESREKSFLFNSQTRTFINPIYYNLQVHPALSHNMWRLACNTTNSSIFISTHVHMWGIISCDIFLFIILFSFLYKKNRKTLGLVILHWRVYFSFSSPDCDV
jgi:hypothetical protein